MANIVSLIVKIGARDQEITDALQKLGSNAKKTDADLRKLGDAPLAQQAQKSFAELEKTMRGVSDAQERLAQRAAQTAQGLDAIGGISKLTDRELQQVNRTILAGLDAYKALGQQAPAELQKVADAIKTKLEPQAQGIGGSFTKLLGALGPLGPAIAGAFSVGAVIRFGKALLQSADALQRLSDKTGVGVEGLQRLEGLAVESGNSLEQVTGAISKMQDKLASRDAPFVDALGDMGVKLADLQGLDPDAQFIRLAEAIGKVKDPAERTRLAIDAFGKSGAEILPTLRADADALADSFSGMSTETVRTLDRMGDAIEAFWRRSKAAAANTAASIIQGPLDLLTKSQQQLNQEIANTERAFKALQAGLPNAPKSPGGGLGLPMPLSVPTFGGGTLQHAFAGLDELEKKYGKAAKAAAAAASAMEAINKKIAEASAPVRALTSAQQVLVNKYQQLGLTAGETALKLGVSTRAVEFHTAAIAATAKAFGGLLAVVPQVTSRSEQFRDVANDLASHSLPLVFDKLQNINNGARSTFSSASVHALTFRDSLASLETVLKGINSDFAQMASVAIRAFQQISTLLHSSATVAEKVSGAVTIGLGAAAAMAGNTKTGTVLSGAATGAAVGSLAGPIGTAVGAGIGALIGWAKSKAAEKAMNGVRQAFVDAAGGLEVLNVTAQRAGVTLTALLDARTPQAYEAALRALNDAFAFQASAMATLDETTKRYGFTIEELGPAFQRQELDKQAQQLFKDYEVLIAAGIENAVVTERMSEAVNDYLHKALSLGQEVPSALRPLLQSMVDLGQLTDASGATITSLEDSGVSFALTLSEGFKSLIGEVKKLTEAIARGLGLALDNLPRQIDINIDGNVHFNVPDLPEGAATGGRITAHGVQPFAGGGRVLPFLRRGRDTVPAMLTPGEIVLNAAQQDAVGRALGGGGTVINVHVTASGDFTSIASEQRLARRVGQAVRADVDRAIRRGAA